MNIQKRKQLRMVATKEINKVLSTLENEVIENDLKQIILPLPMNNCSELYTDIVNYRLMIKENDNYTNEMELQKIINITKTILELDKGYQEA